MGGSSIKKDLWQKMKVQPSEWSWDMYSRGQQLVLWALLAVCLLAAAAAQWVPSLQRAPYHSRSADLSALALMMNDQAATTAKSTNALLGDASENAAASFRFNPNTVTAEELQALGLSSKQAQSWLKYRGKSSDRFKKASDIAQLYVLSSKDVERLLPLVAIPEPADEARAPVAAKQASSFPFNPNTVTIEELRQLGLSQQQAQGFLKYRGNATNRFKSADDLDKLYILGDEATRARLKALVEIPASTAILADASNGANINSAAATPSTYGGVVAPSRYEASSSLPLASIDINGATEADLIQIRGIGPYWASRILKYREALGGFASVEQVGSTYGLPDSTFQAMQPYLLLASGIYRPLAINLLAEDELSRHPYVDKKLASVIVNFRKQHGFYQSLEDVRRIKILSAQQLDRLRPYLDFRKP